MERDERRRVKDRKIERDVFKWGKSWNSMIWLECKTVGNKRLEKGQAASRTCESLWGEKKEAIFSLSLSFFFAQIHYTRVCIHVCTYKYKFKTSIKEKWKCEMGKEVGDTWRTLQREAKIFEEYANKQKQSSKKWDKNGEKKWKEDQVNEKKN